MRIEFWDKDKACYFWFMPVCIYYIGDSRISFGSELFGIRLIYLEIKWGN